MLCKLESRSHIGPCFHLQVLQNGSMNLKLASRLLASQRDPVVLLLFLLLHDIPRSKHMGIIEF